MPTSSTRTRPSQGASFARALALRVLWFGASLLGVVALVLTLLVLAPGDPIDLLPDSEALRPVLEERWHLDRPLPARLALYLGQVLSGDLGQSLAYRPGTPVIDVIAGPSLRTLATILSALVLTVAWGGGLAWWTAGRSVSLSRRAIQLLSIVPVFLGAHLVVYTLNESTFAAMNAGWIGRPAWFALPDEPSALRAVVAVAVLAVGSGALAEVHAELEDAIVRIRSRGYVDAARARGEPVWPHIAHNLIPPLATVVSNRMAFFVGGAVILERVLLLNGAGAILWNAALLRDYELALGLSLWAGAVVCTTRLLAEAVRVTVDPRLREAT